MSEIPENHKRVFQILSDVSAVRVDRIKSSDLLADDLGMDSVASMELLGMLDEQFGVEIELEEAQNIKDVATILKLVDERVHD